jgi:Protein of Unknown function (DUF2784)
LIADAIVWLHLAFIAFAVLGGFLTWRWSWVVWAHLPALAWAIWIEVSGGICPLTPLEVRLRRLGGEAGYEGGFIQHYILPLLYPVGLTRETQWVLAAGLIALNAVAYLGFLKRHQPLRSGPSGPR